jgi:hypothetical protein
MRMGKQRLPKGPHKHGKQTKAPKAAQREQRRLEKQLKKSGGMDLDMEESASVKSSQPPKQTPRLNADGTSKPKLTLYKKNNYSISGKNGPRAVSR